MWMVGWQNIAYEIVKSCSTSNCGLNRNIVSETLIVVKTSSGRLPSFGQVLNKIEHDGLYSGDSCVACLSKPLLVSRKQTIRIRKTNWYMYSVCLSTFSLFSARHCDIPSTN